MTLQFDTSKLNLNSLKEIASKYQALRAYKIALSLEERCLGFLDEAIQKHLKLKADPGLMDIFNRLAREVSSKDMEIYEVGHPKEFYLNIKISEPYFDKILLLPFNDEDKKEILDEVSSLDLRRDRELRAVRIKYSKEPDKALLIKGLDVNDMNYLLKDIFGNSPL